jgi:FtsH-binding integral membrane protein
MADSRRVWNIIAIILVIIAVIILLFAWFAPNKNLPVLGQDKQTAYYTVYALLLLALVLWIGSQFNAGLAVVRVV